MSNQESLFNELPEQRKPRGQEESAEDFTAINKAFVRMWNRVKTPHRNDIRRIESILRQVKQLQEKTK